AASAMVAAASAALVAKAMISSPSKLFMGYGEFVGEGFELGIRSMIPDAARASAALVSTPRLPGLGPAPAAAYNTPGGGSNTQVINNTYVYAVRSDEWLSMVSQIEDMPERIHAERRDAIAAVY